MSVLFVCFFHLSFKIFTVTSFMSFLKYWLSLHSFLLATEEVVFKPKYWAICLNIIFVLFFCLLLHRLAVRISLPFHIFLFSLVAKEMKKY